MENNMIEKGKPINQLNMIEIDFHNAIENLRDENVNEYNLNQVMDQIYALMRYTMRCQGLTDNEIERVLKEDVRVQVKQVQKSQRNIVKLWIVCCSSGISALASTGGGLSLFGKVIKDGTFVLSDTAWKGWGIIDQISMPTSKIADCFEKFGGGIAGYNDGANQTGASNVLEMMKTEMSKIRENGRDAEQRSQQLANQSQQAMQSAHQSALEMLRSR